jgi:hypothetical protein
VRGEVLNRARALIREQPHSNVALRMRTMHDVHRMLFVWLCAKGV